MSLVVSDNQNNQRRHSKCADARQADSVSDQIDLAQKSIEHRLVKYVQPVKQIDAEIGNQTTNYGRPDKIGEVE